MQFLCNQGRQLPTPSWPAVGANAGYAIAPAIGAVSTGSEVRRRCADGRCSLPSAFLGAADEVDQKPAPRSSALREPARYDSCVCLREGPVPCSTMSERQSGGGAFPCTSPAAVPKPHSHSAILIRNHNPIGPAPRVLRPDTAGHVRASSPVNRHSCSAAPVSASGAGEVVKHQRVAGQPTFSPRQATGAPTVEVTRDVCSRAGPQMRELCHTQNGQARPPVQ